MQPSFATRPLALLLSILLLVVAVGQGAAVHFDCATVTDVPVEECQALVALYQSNDGDNWSHNSGWLSSTGVCSWEGVRCEAGHVTRLNLTYERLVGALPPEIGALSRLQELDLSHTPLGGSIPPELASLSNLQRLDLSFSHLSGTVPPELGDLSALQELDLAYNHLPGPIPSALGKLSQLQKLDLTANAHTGPVPVVLGELSDLQTLTLSGNRLVDGIPSSLGRLDRLQLLDLSANQLSGSIPPELGALSSLQTLRLSANQLTGSIPAELGNLSHLQELTLNNNQLRGEIPLEFGNLHSLQQLYLAANSLSGRIPSSLGNLSVLVALDLSNNALSAAVPFQLASMGADLPDGENLRINLDYNALSTTDEPTRDFLLRWNPSFFQTQTVAPTGFSATALSADSIRLGWTPIAYTADGGFYEVSYALAAGALTTVTARTAHKGVDALTISGLTPDTRYYFRICTFTPAHDRQQNDLYSGYAGPVSATTLLPAIERHGFWFYLPSVFGSGEGSDDLSQHCPLEISAITSPVP